MNGYKMTKTKLWNEVSMLASGVLTSLIYELLLGSSYELDIEGKYYEITATGMSAWCAVGLVVITFFCLWALISVLIPWALRIKQRLSYDKIKKITAKELIRTLDESKVSIKKLYPVFYAENRDEQNANLIKLYSKDIARIILLLQRKFLPQNKKMRTTIERFFRQHEHATIISIEQKPSCYELAAVIALLKDMVIRTKSVAGDDVLLYNDCTEMETVLSKLDELIKKFVKREKDDIL